MTSTEAKTIKDFKKCDFTEMHKYFKEKSEERKQMTKEQKAKIKEENEKIVEEYGYAEMDGHKLGHSNKFMQLHYVPFRECNNFTSFKVAC